MAVTTAVSPSQISESPVNPMIGFGVTVTVYGNGSLTQEPVVATTVYVVVVKGLTVTLDVVAPVLHK